RRALAQVLETLAGQHDHGAVLDGLHRSGARFMVHQRHLAERIAGAQMRDHHILAFRTTLADFQLAAHHKAHEIAVITFAADHITAVEAVDEYELFHLLQIFFAHAIEQTHARQDFTHLRHGYLRTG